jgi:hypothetical protein
MTTNRISAGILCVCDYCVKHRRNIRVILRFSPLCSMEMETSHITRTTPGPSNNFKIISGPFAVNNLPLSIVCIFNDLLIWCVKGLMTGEVLPVETVATDGYYLFRRLGVHWNVKVSSACLERKLRKCVL